MATDAPLPLLRGHELGELPDDPRPAAVPRPIERVHDVAVTVSVELGRVRLPMGRLLDLAPGAVVALGRDAGAPVDVLVNGHVVGHGEVVVRGDELGVRLESVAAPTVAVPEDDAAVPVASEPSRV